MIKITSTPFGNITSANRLKKARKSGSGDFAGLVSAAEEEVVSSTKSVKAPSSVNPLLGLQEISDEELAQKRAIKHGQMTLDALEELRLALLTGHLPAHLLKEMENLASEQRGQTSDPALEAILDEIELRAAVELAKREMSDG